MIGAPVEMIISGILVCIIVSAIKYVKLKNI